MSSKSSNLIETELRIIYRMVIETLKSIKTTGWMNIVIITTMAAILSIFGCLFRSSLAVNTFVDSLGSVVEISVYLKDSITPEVASKKIEKIGYIDKIKVITKDKAWTDLKKQMDVPDIKNPLPNTLHVKVADSTKVDLVATKIKEIKGIEGVQYARDIARKLQQISDVTNSIILVILLILGGLTIFVISNTIQLSIQARKEEIEIMRLMGVNNSYIRSPYLMQGAFYGLSGAIIALIPLNIVQIYIIKASNFLQVPVSPFSLNIVILLLLLMGIFVGAFGSVISVRKYLKI